MSTADVIKFFEEKCQENTGEIQLTDHQMVAYKQIEQFCTRKTGSSMMTLEGYAGTGKTTLVSHLIKNIDRKVVRRIAVAAPTNKAVKVLIKNLGEDIGAEYGSIHSFLGLRLKELDDGQQQCKKEGDSTVHHYDLLIVDECSMISHELFKYISTAKQNCLVLFIGDPAQLPPVGDKERSPVFDMISTKSLLTQVVRQAENNPIIKLSMKIRECIEADQMIDPNTISEALPPADNGVAACLAYGGFETATSWALSEIDSGRDARIIAFTNAQVQKYNEYIHNVRFGALNECRFSVSETVIAHQGFDAFDHGNKPVSIHTSEEMVVLNVTQKSNPKWLDIPAHEIELKRDNGASVFAFVADNQALLDAAISKEFADWRTLKMESKKASQMNNHLEANLRDMEAKTASNKAWAMRKAFAPLRHAYAITAHKSQGSTFDTALVDYTNLCKIKTPFDFNRALYVAITRPSQYLAVII